MKSPAPPSDSRPWPASTAFWIGDTVFRKNGDRNPGLVIGIVLESDADRPVVKYQVIWPRESPETETHAAIELLKDKPEKAFP
jgi:hypothetical protein